MIFPFDNRGFMTHGSPPALATLDLSYDEIVVIDLTTMDLIADAVPV
jgi:hypothetical protein